MSSHLNNSIRQFLNISYYLNTLYENNPKQKRVRFVAWSYPSPILPDGKMVSLPIPLKDNLRYSDLSVEVGLTYYDLMKQLRINLKIGREWQILNKETKCHLCRHLHELGIFA